jgi:hypothetical protein
VLRKKRQKQDKRILSGSTEYTFGAQKEFLFTTKKTIVFRRRNPARKRASSETPCQRQCYGDYFRRFSAIFGDFRRFSAIFGDFRRFSAMFAHFWQFPAIFANFPAKELAFFVLKNYVMMKFLINYY